MTLKQNSTIVASKAATAAIKSLYSNEINADVNFVFNWSTENEVKLPAHKILLSAISPVFQSIFYGSSIESNEIRISDASAEAFKQFLQYFYLPELKLTAEYVADVMYLG